MNLFNNFKETADKGTDLGKQFVSKTFEHTKLKAFQITALTLSMIVKLFIIGSLAVLGFVFLSVSGAIFLGEYLNNVALGYLIVAGFFLGVSLIIYLFRKQFDKTVILKVSKMFFD